MGWLGHVLSMHCFPACLFQPKTQPGKSPLHPVSTSSAHALQESQLTPALPKAQGSQSLGILCWWPLCFVWSSNTV